MVDLLEPLKAKLVCMEVPDLDIEFPYNPKEFSLSRNGGFTKKNKGGGPWGGITWECATPDELKFDVVLDVTEPELTLAGMGALMMPISSLASLYGMKDTRSVLDHIMILHKMTIPRWIEENKYKRPPFVAFLWGGFQFFGGIQQVESKVVLFDFRGIPKRAEVSISLLGQAFHEPKDPAELTGAVDEYPYETLDPMLQTMVGRKLGALGDIDPRVARMGAAETKSL